MTTGLHGRSPIEIPPYGIGVPSEKYIAAQYLARFSPRNFASRTKIADRLSPWLTFRILERDGTFLNDPSVNEILKIIRVSYLR